MWVYPLSSCIPADIDECGLTEGPCHEDAACTNTEGSYECECRTGYKGDGYRCTGDLCRTHVLGDCVQIC